MSRRRWIAADNIGAVCGCFECREAGVQFEPQRKVPADQYHTKPRWIHGYELKAWLEAREQARQQIRAAIDASRKSARG